MVAACTAGPVFGQAVSGTILGTVTDATGAVRPSAKVTAVNEGTLLAPAAATPGEIAIFEPSDQAIDFIAEGDTEFVLGSTAKHPHDLVLGNYSVHTSAETLYRGEMEIRRIGRRLRSEGVLRDR